MTTTAPASAPAFRYLGVTDEQDVCDRCGKPELRTVIVLAILDSDGNDVDVVAYGSTCAARALGVRTRGAALLAAARAAHERLERSTRQALEALAYVGVDVQGRPMFSRDGGVTRVWGPAARRYNAANPVVLRTLREQGVNDLTGPVREAVARWTATLADARRVGIITD